MNQYGRGGGLRGGGRGRSGGRAGRRPPQSQSQRGFRSKIKEIEDDTFNVGSNKFVAQFHKSKENVANYIVRRLGPGNEGHLAAEEIRTGTRSTVPLPPALAGADAANPDEILLREMAVRNVGKLRGKLEGARKSAFSILFDQCSETVKDKLRASDG